MNISQDMRSWIFLNFREIRYYYKNNRHSILVYRDPRKAQSREPNYAKETSDDEVYGKLVKFTDTNDRSAVQREWIFNGAVSVGVL